MKQNYVLSYQHIGGLSIYNNSAIILEYTVDESVSSFNINILNTQLQINTILTQIYGNKKKILF